MKGYKSVSINEELYEAMSDVVDNDSSLYRNISDFVNSTLREKVTDFRNLKLRERDIESKENILEISEKESGNVLERMDATKRMFVEQAYNTAIVQARTFGHDARGYVRRILEPMGFSNLQGIIEYFDVYKKGYELKMVRKSYPGYSLQFDGREVPPHNLPMLPKVNLSRIHPDMTPEIPKMSEMQDKHLRKFGSGCPNCQAMSLNADVCPDCGHDLLNERYVEIVLADIPEEMKPQCTAKKSRIQKLLGDMGLRWWQDFDEAPFLQLYIESDDIVHDTVTLMRWKNDEKSSVPESGIYESIRAHFSVNRNPKDGEEQQEQRETEFVLGVDIEELEKMKKKDLQALCDENGITYKKKDTNTMLLDSIKKEDESQNNKRKRSTSKQMFITKAFGMARTMAKDEEAAIFTLRKLVENMGFKDTDDIIEEFREDNKKTGYQFGTFVPTPALIARIYEDKSGLEE